jgi:hypothetical protein
VGAAGCGLARLSPAVISRLTAEWKDEYTRWPSLHSRHLDWIENYWRWDLTIRNTAA